MRVSVLLLLAFGFAAACSDPPAPRGDQTEAAAQEIRLIALAPHLAELVFAAGAGDRLVGVSAFSDYPPAVGELPVVGDAFTVDLESLALLRPSIILAWESGTPVRVVDELRERGYRVEVLRTRGLADIAPALERIGSLAGVVQASAEAGRDFDAALVELRERYADQPPITVFYQIASRPLYTVSDGHFIDDALAICGGVNVFSELEELAPAVSAEAVVARDPEVILAGAYGGDPFTDWQRWPSLRFNRYANRFTLPADEVGRATPRLVAGVAATCRALAEGRRNREAASKPGSSP